MLELSLAPVNVLRLFPRVDCTQLFSFSTNLSEPSRDSFLSFVRLVRTGRKRRGDEKKGREFVNWRTIPQRSIIGRFEINVAAVSR